MIPRLPFVSTHRRRVTTVVLTLLIEWTPCCSQSEVPLQAPEMLATPDRGAGAVCTVREPLNAAAAIRGSSASTTVVTRRRWVDTNSRLGITGSGRERA